MTVLLDGVARSQSRAVVGAITALLPAVLERGRPADRELTAWLRAHHEFGGRDRRLISDLFFDLFRWWGWLAPLVPAPADPFDSIPAAWVRLLLALGLAGGRAPAGLLRLWASAAGVAPESFDAVEGAPTSAARLAVVPGLDPGALIPATLVPAWVPTEVEIPPDGGDWLDWMQRRAPLWVRVQRGDPADVVVELRAAGLDPVPHARLSRALGLGYARVHLPGLAAYGDGRLDVQDLASQAIVAVCGAAPGEHWLDACAGAGGKTLGLAAAVAPGGRVVAADVRASALEALRERARRAGVGGIQARLMDGATRPAQESDFAGVLVDAPCSGSGAWRRSPWARWQLDASALPRFAERQLALLNACAHQVRSGGHLVYATCSLFRAENRAVVDRFLTRTPSFALAPFPHPITGAPTDGQTMFWPWDGDHDAMYVARLRRLPE